MRPFPGGQLRLNVCYFIDFIFSTSVTDMLKYIAVHTEIGVHNKFQFDFVI